MADALGGSAVARGLVTRLDPISMGRFMLQVFDAAGRFEGRWLILIFLPLVALALIQTRRLFRTEAADTRLHVARCAAPLLVVSTVCWFAVSLFLMLFSEASRQQEALLRETHVALETLQPAQSTSATGPQRFTVDDLARVAPLSADTRRWLRDANIILVPQAPAANTLRGFRRVYVAAARQPVLPYSAVIRSANGGHNCSLTYAAIAQERYGALAVICD